MIGVCRIKWDLWVVNEIWIFVSGICSLFVPTSKLDDGVTGEARQGRGSGRRESKIEWKLHSDAAATNLGGKNCDLKSQPKLGKT